MTNSWRFHSPHRHFVASSKAINVNLVILRIISICNILLTVSRWFMLVYARYQLFPNDASNLYSKLLRAASRYPARNLQIIFKWGGGTTLSTFSQSIFLIHTMTSQKGIQASFFTSRSVICVVSSRGRVRMSVTYLSVISSSMKITYFTFYPKAFSNSRLYAGVNVIPHVWVGHAQEISISSRASTRLYRPHLRLCRVRILYTRFCILE